MSAFTYSGTKLNQISFPLGGIGTGSIGLAGNGRLIDWEIFNKPNKESYNGFSHFAVRAEKNGRVVDARVLNSDLPPPYAGTGAGMYNGSGFGPSRFSLAGMPHFHANEFKGAFPVAELAFIDDSFPGRISMTVCNPFIPLNDKDSGIPAALFDFSVSNPSDTPIDYTMAGVLCNPFPAENVHSLHSLPSCTSLHLASNTVPKDDTGYGELAVSTDCPDVSSQLYFFQGAWFDTLEMYWHDLCTPGHFSTLPDRQARTQGTALNHALLAAHVRVEPGKTEHVRFCITWHCPNCENYWNEKACEDAVQKNIPLVWKNYYATVWNSSLESAEYTMHNWNRLWRETLAFKNALFNSSIPSAALDAVSANISILKSPTVLRLQDGTFYGWEGCHCRGGCCEGSCTHVWNYAQALPFLFPALERSMREADYTYNFQPDGRMPFRLQLPLGAPAWDFRPCADGQFGDVLKTYRDWKICGDTAWLKSLWPKIKKSIEFAWSPDNKDRWDPYKTGVLHGRQHHTLDMELFGPNSWLTGFYLGALKAAAEMAEALEEPDTAAEYNALFQKGSAWVDNHLFNGSYYHQQIDLSDKSLIESYDALKAYWNDESGEIKYQVGEGCIIDQVLAQWHADLYGLGNLFNPINVNTALQSLFANNFKTSMRTYPNPCRIFCLNDESGMVICEWPATARRPIIPVPYSQETMHGYEYAVAILMINRGLVSEGMRAVAAVRDRYDGEKRNPWNEIECGNNYARSMASYALLNVFSGFSFDMPNNSMGFKPILPPPFSTFWSLDAGWGTFEMTASYCTLRLLYGSLTLKELSLPPKFCTAISKVSVSDKSCQFIRHDASLEFPSPLNLKAGQFITIIT